MAQWISDDELVNKFGEEWITELDFSAEDFSAAGKRAMVSLANEWLDCNNKALRFVDCKDADDEIMWLIA